jgi:integrase
MTLSRKQTGSHSRKLYGRHPGLRAEITRHGTAIWVYRAPGVYHQMKSPPGSLAFWQEYADVSRGKRLADAAPVTQVAQVARRDDEKSLGWLIGQFCASKEWRAMRPNTAANYASILRRIEKMNGSEPFLGVTAKSIAELRDEIAKASPTMADKFVSVMRVVFGWACRQENGALLPANPAVGVSKVKADGDHHHMWTEDERQRFTDHWQRGSQERLAYDLLYGSGQRRSDVVLMGPKNISRSGKVISLTQVKTNKDIAVPMSHRWFNLGEAIVAARVTGAETFIVGQNGKPRSPDDFGRWFGAAAKAAGLKDCTSHGLRRAASAAAVEAGYTAGQIMGFFGYTLQQAEDYVKEFSRNKVAEALFEPIIEETPYPVFSPYRAS